MRKWSLRLANDNGIHVNIGEVKVGRKGEVLRATLGSCVGIAFVWKKKGLCALAHCLLPEAHESSFVINAKYVSQAVPSLMALLKVKEGDVSEIEVSIAGGGNMMSQLARENVDHIGLQNIAAAKKYLTKYGFKVREVDIAGDIGRKMFIDCTSGTVSVLRLETTT